MAEDLSIDIEKLVADKIEKGVVGSTLILENRKLGDESVSQLSNLEVLSEVITLDLGENNISDTGVHSTSQLSLYRKLKNPEFEVQQLNGRRSKVHC